MNQSERRVAEKLALKINASGMNCPSCGDEGAFNLTSNPLQVKCCACTVLVTIHVQEQRTRVFDKQRQVERALPPGPPTRVQEMTTKTRNIKPIDDPKPPMRWTKDNEHKEQKSQRFSQRKTK